MDAERFIFHWLWEVIFHFWMIQVGDINKPLWRLLLRLLTSWKLGSLPCWKEKFSWNSVVVKHLERENGLNLNLDIHTKTKQRMSLYKEIKNFQPESFQLKLRWTAMGREFRFEINPEDQSYIRKVNFHFRNIQVQFRKN